MVGAESAEDGSPSYILTKNSGKTSGFLVNSSKNFANNLVILSASKELLQWITKGCQWFIILAKGWNAIQWNPALQPPCFIGQKWHMNKLKPSKFE